MSERKTFPAIPEPTADPESLRACVAALKQVVEILTTSRGGGDSSVANQADVKNLKSSVQQLGQDTTQALTQYLTKADNLQSVADPVTSRGNLGAAKRGTNTDITSLDIDEYDIWSVTIPYPENSRYYIVKPYVRHAATVDYVRAYTQAGAATVDFQHNGTSMGSAGAISATTSSFSPVAVTSGTTVAVGDYFYGIPASADTAEFLTIEVWYKKKIP